MKITRTILAGLALLVLLGSGLAQAYAPRLQEPEIVPLNGTAYWATTPTEPDFEGVSLIPFQAHNPTLDVYQATLAHNEGYLEPAVPVNIQVSHSGWITGASHFVNDFSECMVAIDPTDPDHLLGSSKFFYQPATYDFYTGVFESYDGGQTWTEQQPEGVEWYTLTSDPVNTFDDQGNGYFTLLTRDSGGYSGVDMLKKPAGGDWELPVVVDSTTSTDKQWIIGDQDPQGISPYAGNLYMSWTSFGGPAVGIVFSRSTDGNQSWSAPISLAGGSVQGSIPGVAPDGTVYVVFGRDIFYGGSGTMEFVQSSDGGATFSAPSVAANMTAIPYYLPDPFGHWVNFRSPASLPAFAISPVDGNLYIAWSDYRNGDADIYLTRSTDGGATWGPQIRLNDDPIGNGIDQFQPQLSVAPNGRVAAMWFDRRLPCPDLPWIPPAHVGILNGCIDTFMTRSFDEGQTWAPNLRVSEQTWDWTLNLPITSGGAGFIGDYQGIASSNAYDYPFWNATANLGENAENYQQIFVARVPAAYRDLSPSEKRVDPAVVEGGGALTYTLLLENGGVDDAPGVYLSDTLPLSTTFLTGTLWASSGQAAYEPGLRTVTWTGAVSVGIPVTVTFGVETDPGLGDGATIVNRAFITDGAGAGLWREATATVSLPPTIVATDPADGETGVALTETVAVTFSEAMDTASLSLTVVPDPGGWVAQWMMSDTVLLLSHDPFAEATTYTLTVAAQDHTGLDLVPGPVPNPWSFHTAAQPPMVLATWPADGATGVPLSETVVVTFSEVMDTSSLSLTAVPDPGGWSAQWAVSDTVVLLSHDPFAPATTYTLTVAAHDLAGLGLAAGPAPNPWRFATGEGYGFMLYLPLVYKSH